MSAETTQEDARAEQIRQRLLAGTTLTERYERLAGVRTAIHEAGDGPPMILLHGQGEFWGVWMGVIDELVRTHHVIVVDLPGHGASIEIDGKLDAERVSRWLDELIDATCSEPPVVAGHLLGGAIAARYAVEHGERLAQLVLVDTLGLVWYRPALQFAIPLVRFLARPTPTSRDRLFNECFIDFDRVAGVFGSHWDDALDYALDRAQRPEVKAAANQLLPRVGVPAIAADDLDRITTPTTLIHGRHDLQVPLKAAERASARHGWPLHVIEDARDDPAAEQPVAFLAALRSVVTTPTSGRASSQQREDT